MGSTQPHRRRVRLPYSTLECFSHKNKNKLILPSSITSGYTSSCRQIISAARYLTSSLRTLFSDDLYVLGDPKGPVVAFNSKTVNIYAVGDVMSKKGWHLSALGGGGGLHMAFTVGGSDIWERRGDRE